MANKTCVNYMTLSRFDYASMVERKLPISMSPSFIARAALRHLATFDPERLAVAIREQEAREKSADSDLRMKDPQTIWLSPFGGEFMVQLLESHPGAKKSIIHRTAIAELAKLSDTDLLAALKAQSRPEADMRFPELARSVGSTAA